MKLIKPSFEIIEQAPDLIGMHKHIERIGRVCYKSEDSITDDSYEKFVNMLKNNKHGAMLEHGTVYLKIINYYPSITGKYELNKYSVCNYNSYDDYFYITTNYRVIAENGWEDDLKYWCEPTEYHEKRHSVLFTTDRGVSHEFVRNRGSKGNAFAQESTRYCNYSKDKFSNEIAFIIPNWMNIAEGIIKKDTIEKHQEAAKADMSPISNDSYYDFLIGLGNAEKTYHTLIAKGWMAQQARQVLPNALKTELVMTCYALDWKHFLSLRADKAAHPSAQELAYPLKDEFIKRGYINE